MPGGEDDPPTPFMDGKGLWQDALHSPDDNSSWLLSPWAIINSFEYTMFFAKTKTPRFTPCGHEHQTGT